MKIHTTLNYIINEIGISLDVNSIDEDTFYEGDFSDGVDYLLQFSAIDPSDSYWQHVILRCVREYQRRIDWIKDDVGYLVSIVQVMLDEGKEVFLCIDFDLCVAFLANEIPYDDSSYVYMVHDVSEVEDSTSDLWDDIRDDFRG